MDAPIELRDPSPKARRILLPSLALLSLLGVMALATGAWVYEPIDRSIVGGVIVFLQNIVVAVLGYYTGSAFPGRE